MAVLLSQVSFQRNPVTLQAVGNAAAEGLVAATDVLCEQTHGEYLEEEELGGEVDEAEEEQPEGTEIEGEQTVPEHQRQRRAVDILLYLLRHLIHIAKLAAQNGQQALELGGDLPWNLFRLRNKKTLASHRL